MIGVQSCVVVLLIVFVLHSLTVIYSVPLKTISHDGPSYHLDRLPDLSINFINSDGHVTLKGLLGGLETDSPLVSDCRGNDRASDVCLETANHGRLIITTRYDQQMAVECENIFWQAEEQCQEIEYEHCYNMSSAHWYGATQIKSQLWPIEKWDRPSTAYITGDSYNDQYGGVQDRYWLSSNGIALYVDWNVPLWVSMNDTGDQELCFKTRYQDSPYHNLDESTIFLNYTICQGNDVKHIHEYMIENYLGKPDDIPDELLFRYPIWSTWARYGKDINDSLVLEFAQEIAQNNFSHAQIEIDDDWENEYGRLDFDEEKFPDPKAMVDELTSLGFRTTLWIHPFCDINSDYVWVGGLQFHYMRDPGMVLPALTTWWNGVGTILDFTTVRSTQWYVGHLDDLRENYGISSFKFDAGEANLLPACYVPGNPFQNPSTYSTIFAEMAMSVDPDVRNLEVRVGAQTQHLPVFVRMMDKDSRWDDNNGLRTIIPHALTYSILGYPFILPDMIGGNAYGGNMPDKELFIRWLEVNVFLPGFQFSISPWQYDQEVVDISTKMVQLHEEYADMMIALGREATVTGAPIIRPLWWISQDDDVALSIDSEFLLGDGLLVAPILEEGARQRDIYLPRGTWTDQLRGGDLEGETWYYNYTVELDELPYFIKED